MKHLPFSRYASMVLARFLPFSSLLLFFSAHPEGFVAGTLVSTPDNLTPIEQIIPPHQVIAYTQEHAHFKPHAVLQRRVSATSKLIHLTFTEGATVSCARDQLFYVIDAGWMAARTLTPGMQLLTCTGTPAILLTSEHDTGIYPIYLLTIKTAHTFCVSRLGIVTHNVGPFLALIAAWPAISSAATGIASFAVKAAGALVVGTVVHLIKERHRNRSRHGHSQQPSQNNGGGGSDKDPDQPGKKERIINTISKTAFFNNEKIKEMYEYWMDGVYKLKKGAEGIENAAYLKWDHLHNDVEAWSRMRKHLGSINPTTWQMYKGPAGHALFS